MLGRHNLLDHRAEPKKRLRDQRACRKKGDERHYDDANDDFLGNGSPYVLLLAHSRRHEPAQAISRA